MKGLTDLPASSTNQVKSARADVRHRGGADAPDPLLHPSV